MALRLNQVSLQFIFSMLALLCGLAAFSALSALHQPPPKRELAERIYNVEVFEVQPARLQEIINGYGSARAEHEVQFSAQVGGEVTSVSPRLKVGEKVIGPAFHLDLSQTEVRSQRRDGDLLLTIDPQAYHERLAQCDTSIAEAEAEIRKLTVETATNERLLNKARRDYEISKSEFAKLQKLFASNGATESQLQQQQLDLQRYEEALVKLQNEHDLMPVRREQLDAKLLRLQADRKLAALDVERTQVRPPFSGSLSEVTVEKGQFVQPGTPLFRVVETRVAEIPVPLQATDFSRVADLMVQGQFPRVLLAENDSAAHRWEGRVVRLAPQADPETRTLTIFVEVQNAENAVPLLPGTFVQARVEGPVSEGAVVIPREALRGDGPQSRVFLANESGTVHHALVTVVRRLEGLAFVTGLQKGQRVVLTNLDVLYDAAPVKVQSIRTLDDELAQVSLLRRLNDAAPAP